MEPHSNGGGSLASFPDNAPAEPATPLKSPLTVVTPLSVHFINNRLPNTIPEFSTALCHYDINLQQYVPNEIAAAPNIMLYPPRTEVKTTTAMEFWQMLLADAVKTFKETRGEPEGRVATGYSIRDKDDWDAIYSVLESARGHYQRAKGPVGTLRRVRRKFADHSSPLAGAVKTASQIAPDSACTTPVLGAVELILDVIKTTAKVRNEVLHGLDDLMPILSEAELWLGMFQGDEAIRKAAISLTVAIIDAIERSIGFFISKEVVRGTKSLWYRDNYETPLRESLEAIKSESRKLRNEAGKSHIYESHVVCRYSAGTQHMVYELQRSVSQIAAGGLNSMKYVMDEHAKQKDAELRKKDAEIAYWRGSFLQLLIPPSPQPAQIAETEWSLSQPALRDILGDSGADLLDLVYMSDNKEQVPVRQRARAENIANTQSFRTWAISITSSKLLLFWDLSASNTLWGLSPLSTFCITLAGVLTAYAQFLTVTWFCSRHLETRDGRSKARSGPEAMLTSIIDQLLRRHIVDTGTLRHDINLGALQEGGLEERIKLLEWTVRQLSEALTVFIIIDGIQLYERSAFEEDMLMILPRLLRLVDDSRVKTTLKILLTSVPGPDIIRAAFEEEGSILNVATVPLTESVPSKDRFRRDFSSSS